MTLFYCPLEPLKERYTMQWSAPKTGWLERNWLKEGVEYRRVDGALDPTPKTIKTGCVLDAVARSKFAFSQVSELLSFAESGELTSDDVVHFDDFWHPGIEALPYAFELLGVKPKMYAFLHAQSVDEFDFTYPMRGWMRFFEQGIGTVLDGIFVCGPCLRDLVVFGGIAPAEKVHITGHPFSSEEVRERMGPLSEDRECKVVYSSRFDREKNPMFFLDIVEQFSNVHPQVKFLLCSGAPRLRSNLSAALERAEWMHDNEDRNFEIKDGLTKEEYYQELKTAKVQLNTADQDFVAITLLESSVAGCYPVYPYFRSFPETFLHRPGFMYERLDLQGACDFLWSVLQRNDLWTQGEVKKREWIHSRFDTSWVRMLQAMGYQESWMRNYDTSDPYSC